MEDNDGVQYIVPPLMDASGESGVMHVPKTAKRTVKPVEKPNKALGWLTSHKVLIGALFVMASMIGAVSFVMITGKQISVAGYQLNPLYNRANVPEPGEDFPNPNTPTNPAPTSGVSTAPTGFQISVRDNGCSNQERSSALITPNSSGSVTDANAKDPDCARISMSTANATNVPQTSSIYSNDFRIGTRVAESENGCSSQIDSSIKWTPWASDGGGASQQAVGTASSNDPDCVWIHYETRPMPAGKGIRDVRVGIASGGATQFTPWARAGGGVSAFSRGNNLRPTSVTLEAQLITVVNPPINPVPGSIGISGSIPNGTIGQQTLASMIVTGVAQTPCTWSIVSIVPSISNATINTATVEGTTANFIATPSVNTVHQVSVRATCQNGQVANATIPWVVAGTTIVPDPKVPTPTSNLVITGAFQAGTVGQAYLTTVRTSGQGVLNCTWRLDNIVPSVNGAVVEASTSPIPTTNSIADFKATPSVAGLYRVTIAADCGTSGAAQNIFDWVVGDVQVPINSNQNTCLDQTTVGKLSAVYRYWSPAYGDHLYTTDVREKPNGYRFEGVSGYVFGEQTQGTVPVYRSAQRQIGSHYYTTANDDPTQYGYVSEGILGYAYPTAVAGSDPWYRMHKGGSESDYVHTISEGEKNAIRELGYVEDGVVAYICGGSEPTELQPMFRLWGVGDGDHFYTTNFSERDNLLTRNYDSEGITGYIYGVRAEGSVPIHRAYSRAIGDHLYSANEAEARSPGYIYEGVMGYISPVDTEKTTPLYRLYNPTIGDHFYTASSTEASAAIQNGYRGEGVTGYLYLSQ